MLKFEWDARKASSNRRKHGVSFEEALSVFADPKALTFDDVDHSDFENRSLTFGTSSGGKLLVVSIRIVATLSESSARAKRPPMKNVSTKKDDQHIPELTRAQLGRGVRGKYFKQMSESSNVVVLRPEIRKAFPTSKAVNDALAGLLALTQQTNRLMARKSAK